jgi:glycosyltransferase involved in cell wall biosynthesis
MNKWEKRKARKQQFMLHLSKRDDVQTVVYVEPPLNLFRLLLLPFLELNNGENRRRWKRALLFKLEELSPKLLLYTPLFPVPFAFRVTAIYNFDLYLSSLLLRWKLRRLALENTVVWLYHPFDRGVLDHFRDRVLSVFDWAEAWSRYFTEFGSQKREQIKALELDIIKRVDLVFTVSQHLLGQARAVNPHSYQLFDGTVPELFDHCEDIIPADMKNLPHPILGYAGLVHDRIDFDLIEQLSDRLPHCSLVFLGHIARSTDRIRQLSQRSNVHFLGLKDYAELPAYMAAVDVCLLPYIPDTVTSPATKIFDYLATGKPTVSTDLVEMDRFRHLVKLARTSEEFIDKVRECLAENSPELAAQRKEEARRNSWALRTQEIMDTLHHRLSRHQ